MLILLHLLKLAEIQYQNVSKCKILHFKDLEFNVLLMFIKIQIWKYKILSIHFWMKSIKLMHIELWIDLSKLFQEEWLQQCKSREIQWGRSYPLLILQLHWYLFDKYLCKDKEVVFYFKQQKKCMNNRDIFCTNVHLLFIFTPQCFIVIFFIVGMMIYSRPRSCWCRLQQGSAVKILSLATIEHNDHIKIKAEAEYWYK